MTSSVRRSSRSSRPVARDIDVFGLTHMGRVRRDNQDHFLIASLHKMLRVQQSSLPKDDLSHIMSESRAYLFLVADGVGSGAEGHRASGTALRVVAEYVTHFMDLYRHVDADEEKEFLTALSRSVEHSHEIIRARSEREYGGRHATTLTMVCVHWPCAYLVQVGDSRCYRLRDAKLERMTRDQTMAQALIEAGALSESQATSSPLHHVLVSALGGKEATLMTATAECEWDDVLLLCTDGLTRHVADEEIAETLRALTSAETGCRRLVDLALERGGSDNVTVVIGRLRPRKDDAPERPSV